MPKPQPKRVCRACGKLFPYNPKAELQWYWCKPCAKGAMREALIRGN